MRKILYIIVLFIVAYFTMIANPAPDNKKGVEVIKPDLEKIKDEVTNPKSKYYYPVLMKRYERNETIMNVEDYRYLYLGMMFQEDYDPYRKSIYHDRIQDLYYRESHSRRELDTIIAYAELSLASDPFDLEQMTYLIYALRGRGKNNTANIWQYRLNHILQAIISTGTGMDTANAWYVINPRHEYNIVNFQGRTVEGQEFVEPYYEYIKVASNPEASTKLPDGYYFNIHQLLEEYYRKYPE